MSQRKNLILFIISYVINNLVSGILYDTYINYLQEVSLNIATSFWSFYGYATFLSAFFLLFVNKTGYKFLLAFCAISCSLGLFAVIVINVGWILYITTLLALTGVQLHFIMLAPFVAQNSQFAEAKSIDWYAKTYYMGYVGYFATTYLGGALTVKMFSVRAGLSYSHAKKITEHIADVSGTIREAYIDGNQDVLLMGAILSLVAIIPILMIRDKKTEIKIDEKEPVHIRAKYIMQALFRKEACIYLLYWSLISFAMGLFTSYYTIYLNRNLHIDRAMSSYLVSISYLAIVLFMLFTPYVVRKLGNVYTICLTVFGSIPFMLVIAKGDAFGDYMVIAVGIALFMRAGLANLGSPAESALSMAIMPESLRPAYTSIVNFTAGIVSIVSGLFTGKFLFLEQSGYRRAYYIAATLYFIAAVVMLIGLRKYNKKVEE